MGISIFGGEKMKKILLVSALVLVIATSMVSGTLAAYQISLPDMATGSVVAKKFVLVEGTPNTFKTNVKIAPTESKEMTFSVTNDNGAGDISEVNMNVQVTIVLDDISTTSGKEVRAIPPLTVKVYKGAVADMNLLSTSSSTLTNGKGTLEYNLVDLFTAEVSRDQIFTVVVTWTGGDNATDTALAGPTHGTKLTVTVMGTQHT